METIEIELSDDIILALALEAHKLDITLNQHVNNVLMEYIKQADLEEAIEEIGDDESESR